MADVDIFSSHSIAVEQESSTTPFTRPVPRSARRTYRNIAWGMVITDGLSIALAMGLSYLFRDSFSSISRAWIISISAIPLAWIVVFYAHGLYSTRLLTSVEEFRRVLAASTLGMVVIVMLSYWSQSSFSRLWVAVAWAFALGLELFSRAMWRLFTNHLKETGALRIRTIVVGTNGEAEGLRQRLNQKGSGFNPLGFFPAGELYVQSDADMNLLGKHGELTDVIRRTQAECLFIASTEVTPQTLAQLVKTARWEGVDVRVSAALPEMISSRVSVQSVGGIMSMALKPVRLTGPQAVMKRGFDLVLASIGLILLLPVVCIAAIAIRLETKGPIVFRQARITKGGRVFEMFKLRTMTEPEAEYRLDTSAPFFKLDQDPRVTRVGRFLRKTSLDEIPQLFNVIRGDMSLVGPRPLPVDQVEANLDLLASRHEVQAGVTGWWQISGRSLVRPEDAVNMDLFYIENWSLALDVYVLFKTLGVVLTRSGAQ
jgi:exopolysaccharide biosynthesis polyprenyl glycosylphosphotransferase